MNKRLTAYYFLVVTIFIGYFLTIQLKSNVTPYQGIVTIPKVLEMKSDIENLKKETQNLADSINQSKLKLQSYEENLNSGGNLFENMQKELELATAEADYAKMQGPGIIITMNDSTAAVSEGENPNLYVIHDADILEIVNELRAAGAEAISINDERVTATSNIRCGGPVINIDGKRHAVPFVVKAIGDPKTLVASATAPSSYIDLMEYYGIRIDIKKVEKLTINAYDGKYKLKYQTKAKGGE